MLQDHPNPELRWGVSLGIFKSEEAARAYLAQMSQKGVRSARLVEYKTPMKKFAFQVQADSQVRSGIDKLKSAFPGQQMRECALANAD
ncbi:MAG: SPOR domain-containing protein [Burkholderiaceae bacterium]